MPTVRWNDPELQAFVTKNFAERFGDTPEEHAEFCRKVTLIIGLCDAYAKFVRLANSPLPPHSRWLEPAVPALPG